MESKRQQKYSKLIQKELGEIFQKEGRPIVDKAMVTVTRVLMSPDLGLAKINLSFLLADPAELIDKVDDNKSQIRKFLGRRIGKSVRVIPELAFFLDESAAYAQHMDAVISKLDIPEAPEEDEDDDENI
ncbi:30S ribosome-binding factor RbfA [Cyclobacterium marinum]|uniref:Ribosome-binding factor A n=1 Tax=Cyclobacterium marinum (strain ATCC 25205 / DSM 745 / LMG 13164 / NCIMB 1802) TaxID=880070 RepID=G0IWV2_CYCMS|nr:30S ribosome-binding factor RbfA [Cyclobacterium marinum]AEL24870.1 Ribosome-binding factor A [Cyclobacterium marinum DSM 745]MBI0401654.1 30S ribosome-binding factor RbfA [Cyclobacterium marinum]MBR9775459.1 30S ribosome-binding factor RbfA [Cytophagales bacterium]|tara:strand:+ start:9488 stop:9874 length:387 start_codon:yes stop_codon:yes gene_type:complete